MKKHVALLAFAMFVSFGARHSAAQCLSTAIFHNVACCDGTIQTETLASGLDVPRGYQDGQGWCGVDDIGNPCYIGRVDNCTSGAKLLPNPIQLKNAKKVFAGSGYEQLAGLVPMCMINSQNPTVEYKLPPHRLFRWRKDSAD